MFSFLLTTCTNCDNLEDALCSIDGVLAQYGKNAWQNTAFMTNKDMPYIKIRQLMYYKEILTNIRWNQDMYCPYDYPTIVSRVRGLLAGEFRIARKMVYTPLTTTTTTTSTSTTSTTSTTTSTSTSTTSTTSTSTTSTSSTTTTSTSSTSSTSSTTSTTTTATTTRTVRVFLYNRTNPTQNGVSILSTSFDPYPPNENALVPGLYPIVPGGQNGFGRVRETFIPGTFTFVVSGQPFGSISIRDSDNNYYCQNYNGSSTYTFPGVVAAWFQNLGDLPINIDVWPVGTNCLTTSTTSTTTTSTTTLSGTFVNIINNSGTALAVTNCFVDSVVPSGFTFPINTGQQSQGNVLAGPGLKTISIVLTSATGWGKLVLTDSQGISRCVPGGLGMSPSFVGIPMNNLAITTVTIFPPGDNC